MGRYATKATRQRFIKRSKLVCIYCGKVLTIHTATIEHVIARCYKIKKGSDTTNWKIACNNCNNNKRNKLQSYILNLSHLRKTNSYDIEMERKHIAKIGIHFLDKINIGFWVYDVSKRKTYSIYEG